MGHQSEPGWVHEDRHRLCLLLQQLSPSDYRLLQLFKHSFDRRQLLTQRFEIVWSLLQERLDQMHNMVPSVNEWDQHEAALPPLLSTPARRGNFPRHRHILTSSLK